MGATRMNLPLTREMPEATFSEARKRRLPATRLVPSIVEDWLAEQERARVAEEIRCFAREHAGTDVDLSPALEEAALAELRRPTSRPHSDRTGPSAPRTSASPLRSSNPSPLPPGSGQRSWTR